MRLCPELIATAKAVAFVVLGVKVVSEIVVFLDYENVRRIGESAFDRNARGIDSPCPVRLAESIAAKRAEPSTVAKIVVVRGRPSYAYQRPEAGKFERDLTAWQHDDRVLVHALDLHYDRRHKPCKEAGVDVRLGLELYKSALRPGFDAIVLFSGDLDLKPAIEDALRLGAHVELAQCAAYGNSTVLGDWFARRSRNWIHPMTAEDYWDALPGSRDAA